MMSIGTPSFFYMSMYLFCTEFNFQIHMLCQTLILDWLHITLERFTSDKEWFLKLTNDYPSYDNFNLPSAIWMVSLNFGQNNKLLIIPEKKGFYYLSKSFLINFEDSLCGG